jgi:hypothetical protein
MTCRLYGENPDAIISVPTVKVTLSGAAHIFSSGSSTVFYVFYVVPVFYQYFFHHTAPGYHFFPEKAVLPKDTPHRSQLPHEALTLELRTLGSDYMVLLLTFRD